MNALAPYVPKIKPKKKNLPQPFSFDSKMYYDNFNNIKKVYGNKKKLYNP